ncbi:MAG: DUF484 family protein [Alphaproteobacteria bacterium]|nr:DUF484 family protein [Alphaproteobacteria bacterium]
MKASPGSQPVSASIEAKDVVSFLRENPGFLNEHPDLMSELDPPTRAVGKGVSDFQNAMIRRLRDRIEETTDVARELIDTSRENLNSQARVHECVLRLLAANSFEQLINLIQTDVAVVLDMDVVALAVESENAEDFPVRSVTLVPPGFVNRLMGPDKEMLLRANISGDPDLFDGAAPLVQSDALVRLQISSKSPAAMLAFGHRDPEKFHPGQATELICFLSAVLAQLVRIWLDLPE